jgi:hypothetical protein
MFLYNEIEENNIKLNDAILKKIFHLILRNSPAHAEKRNNSKYKELFIRVDDLKLYELKFFFEEIYNKIKKDLDVILKE